jgi:DNA-binding transcriptional regulator PaaX
MDGDFDEQTKSDEPRGKVEEVQHPIAESTQQSRKCGWRILQANNIRTQKKMRKRTRKNWQGHQHDIRGIGKYLPCQEHQPNGRN